MEIPEGDKGEGQSKNNWKFRGMPKINKMGCAKFLEISRGKHEKKIDILKIGPTTFRKSPISISNQRRDVRGVGSNSPYCEYKKVLVAIT